MEKLRTDAVMCKLVSWPKHTLSYAGKLEPVKSVLQVVECFWLSCLFHVRLLTSYMSSVASSFQCPSACLSPGPHDVFSQRRRRVWSSRLAGVELSFAMQISMESTTQKGLPLGEMGPSLVPPAYRLVGLECQGCALVFEQETTAAL